MIRVYMRSLHIPTKTVHNAEAIFLDAKCALTTIAGWSGGDWVYVIVDCEPTEEVYGDSVSSDGQVTNFRRKPGNNAPGRTINPWELVEQGA